MSTHEDTSSSADDELARRRAQREADGGERPLRERVRDEARRSKRRHAAASRHRQRTEGPQPGPFDGGDTSGAA